MPASRIRFLPLMLAVASYLSLAAPSLHGQQEAGAAGAQAPEATPSAAPESAPGPVGGVEGYRLGGPSLGHSFFVPRLGLQEVYDSNPGYASTTGGSQSDTITSIAGGLSLEWMKRDSTLSMDYSAGGLLYNSQSQSNGVVQQLAVVDKLTLRRWNLLLGENLAYTPNSQFGLGGLGFIGGTTTTGLAGIGGVTNFNPFTQPTQTIGSTNSSQLSSATVFQAQYFLGARSSLNATGSVGFLHFFEDNLLNSRDVVARIGYDRSLTPRDTLNFSYMASIISYPSGIQGFYSQYIQVGYRRLLTGKLLLSASTGPVITHFTPSNGQTTVPGGQNQVNWSMFAGLDYRLRNGNAGVQYSHGVTGGSGFFVGALTDQVTGGFSHQFTRVWTAGFTGSYARNSSFQQTTPTSTSTSTSTFNYWNAGFFVSRPLGRYSTVRFSYNASRQTSNTTSCANNLACGPIALVQVIGLTFNWTTRPYKLD